MLSRWQDSGRAVPPHRRRRTKMLNNYHYFIVLAEELNISRAASRLYISHQCLSKYLKNLEQEHHVTFFDRTPRLQLTPAGQIYLETLRQIQFLENNLENQLEDIRDSKKGTIRLGTSEGRYRILIPALLSQFKLRCPGVQLQVQYATSGTLSAMLLENELDIALLNSVNATHSQFDTQPIMDEQLYLVISDHMLAQYFPDRYPACKEEFRRGVDLAEFQEVPFVLNHPGASSRVALEKFLFERGLHLNCVMELSQQDLHPMLSARDYAASFCLSMYLQTVQRMNFEQPHCHLNLFPVKNLGVINQLVLTTYKGKILPTYGKYLAQLLKKNCNALLTIEGAP